jgi:acylphosphatase
VTAYGRVQGVFFRASVERLATSRGVAGSVRNRSDGAVEAVFEGAPDAVEELVSFCSRGPDAAAVSRLDVAEEDPRGATGFSVE